MRYLALASDYDGTLAHDGVVPKATIAALERFRQSGRKLILVTGRVLEDLESVFPRLDLFDAVVVENGAVLYSPASRQKRNLADPPKPIFMKTLRQRGVEPLGCGDIIVATCRPHENVVLEVIRELGLELQVIFNKSSVMVLPSGINKRTGLTAALSELELSAHNVAGVGDAENDHAFLHFCECSAAVANAIPALKETADLNLRCDRGAGVVELIEMILADDLASQEPRLKRRRIVIGHEDDNEFTIPAWRRSVLVAGSSGSGKSTFVGGFLETLIKQEYQTCVIDPEGDYENFPGAITIGDEAAPPAIEQVLQTLENPDTHAVVNLIGIPMADRPGYFAALLPRLQEMRLRNGRPHWIVIDEAHHLLPAEWAPASTQMAGELKNLALITVHPDHVAPAALEAVDLVIALGREPESVIRGFAKQQGLEPPRVEPGELPKHQALVWSRDSRQARRLKLIESEVAHKRHKRKYARGELAEEQSFYFRGPQEKLKLRAQNLTMFLQLAGGVDDETWQHHLKQGDYSTWFRENIKDKDLAEEAAEVERDSLNPRESRERIRKAIERRYTGAE